MKKSDCPKDFFTPVYFLFLNKKKNIVVTYNSNRDLLNRVILVGSGQCPVILNFSNQIANFIKQPK